MNPFPPQQGQGNGYQGRQEQGGSSQPGPIMGQGYQGCPENPQGEGQLVAITKQADEESILQVLVNDRGSPMVADTGATYTCVGSKYASHLPMAGKFAKTVGFSGHTQSIPISTPRVTI